jgi:hypothetical protein
VDDRARAEETRPFADLPGNPKPMRDALKLRGHLDSVRRIVAECREVDPPRAQFGLSSLLYLNAALCAVFGLLRLLARANAPQFVLGLAIVVLGSLIAAGLIARKDRDQFRTVLLVALEMALVVALCVVYWLIDSRRPTLGRMGTPRAGE